MWILDTDTDLLGGKRTWVRPGQEAILGRTQFAGATQKAISRRHIVLKVDEVKKYDGLSIRHYSTLTLKDESKKGSTVDGKFINGASVVLDPTVDHEFQMATAPQIFRLKYEPQIFTIHTSSSKKKAPPDPKLLLKDYLAKLEQLDIKCIPEFLPQKTTVTVVTKRNLPISLRALINGSWIVTSSFVDAIAAAATQTKAANGDLLDSPLQEDIANWPDPLEFLPPPGQEPNPKDPEFFKPNPLRKTMFEKWIVVCCTQQHMDIFTGPITDAGGKTELFNIKEGRTKPAELIVHIDRLSGGGRKVIVLHPNVEGDWYVRFRREVEERVGVRFAEQNEFLDAVLLADASVLARPYEAEESIVVHESIELPAPPPSTEVPKSPRRTRTTKEEDPIPPKTESQMAPPSRTSTTSSRTQTRSSRYISQIKIDDSDEEDFTPLPPPPSSSTTTAKPASQIPQSATTSRTISQRTQLPSIAESQQTQGTKRRPIPSSDSEDDNAIMDRMLTGQATLKRQKLQEASNPPSTSLKPLPSAQRKEKTPEPIKPEPEEEQQEDEDVPKPQKGKKRALESRVIQTALTIRQKEDQKAAEEAASNEMTSEEIAAVSKMRNLAIVEVFEITTNVKKPTGRSQAYGDEGDRWDTVWNGRKNFKKFKKRSKDGGVEGPMRRMGAQIMVPLVEHKVKDYGTGEGYWVEPQQLSSVAAGKRREVVSNISHVSETQVGGASGRSGKGAMEVVDIDDDDDDFFEEETARDESLVKKSQRSQKSQTTQQQASGRAVRGGVRGGTQTSTAPAKRTTSNRNSISEEPAKKKAKTMAIFSNEDSEDEDSDDGLKFKFKRT
ncbi:hypothetical protein TWF481_007872 [Arthrobotrys musiformis]|uniref:FHA domain-containing protein n=1 Tax=Arthrobotrys musiformis TaxID=47236 RepID=A0AAV9W7E9_9PEZI